MLEPSHKSEIRFIYVSDFGSRFGEPSFHTIESKDSCIAKV